MFSQMKVTDKIRQFRVLCCPQKIVFIIILSLFPDGNAFNTPVYTPVYPYLVP